MACNALIGRDAKLLLHLQKDDKRTTNTCLSKNNFLERTFMNKYSLKKKIKDGCFSKKNGIRCSFFIATSLTTLPILLSNKCRKCPIFVFLLMLQTDCWMDLRQLGHMKTKTQSCAKIFTGKKNEKEKAQAKELRIFCAQRH